jgi:hypothetical protein
VLKGTPGEFSGVTRCDAGKAAGFYVCAVVHPHRQCPIKDKDQIESLRQGHFPNFPLA